LWRSGFSQYRRLNGRRNKDRHAAFIGANLLRRLLHAAPPSRGRSVQVSESFYAIGLIMKDFSDASFSPEVIDAMTAALEAATATLPEPVSSAHVQALAESILRTAKSGERNPAVLERIALMELQLAPRR
jgi:hypothetical protein